MQAPAPRLRGVEQHAGHVAGAAQFAAVARLDQQLGNPAGVRFVAVVVQSPGQVALGDRGQDLGRGAAACAIHAHVEGPVADVGEAALRVVDLHARHADVGQDGVDGRDPFSRQDRRQRGEVAVMKGEGEANGPESFAGARQVVGVEVEADQSSAGAGAAQQLDRMAGPARGAIDDDGAGPDGQRCQHFVEEDRAVLAVRRAARRMGHRKTQTDRSQSFRDPGGRASCRAVLL